MLRLSENEPVQPVLDKMRELYAKLAIAGITSPWVEQAHEDQVALAAEGGKAWDTGSDLRENSATAS
ncbi:hypothetical protein CLOP_g8175 [Closterium sp. NIES-67]|nr:hypothetical protein CLOP_g8175 [Closterium sp. NIES-67]